MMIAITGLAANAGALIPHSASGSRYVLYPPTNLHVTTIEACFAYLTWDKPHDPGGLTPAGLLGYRIYRDGSLIHYISDPDSLFYYDHVDNIGPFTDSVTAYYDLSSYGYPGEYGQSTAAFVSFTTNCGEILPFFEPWDGGSFSFQEWSFVPNQGNWVLNTSLGNPAPTATFTGSPALTNYDHTLQSIHLDCISCSSANIYIEFDSRPTITTPTSQEMLIIEINYDSTWYPKDTLVNDNSTGVVHHKIDISEVAGKNSRVGFQATGINSADISEWDIDNIYVYAVCYSPPDFNLERTGHQVHLSWGIPCTGKKLNPDQVDSTTLLGYNIYRTDSTGLPPFMKINGPYVVDTEYTEMLVPTFVGVACYYVSAVYYDFNPVIILCEAPGDTLCAVFALGVPVTNEEQIHIFPNPVSDVVNIDSDKPLTGIEVLNFLGETIYSGSFPEKKNINIRMEDNPKGIYLIKLRSGKETVVKKILKN